MIDNFESLRNEVANKHGFVEVTERLYFEALNTVPPIYISSDIWQMGECYTSSLYYTFYCRNNKYYGCLCNSSFALNNCL